jgi:hypothetical protein
VGQPQRSMLRAVIGMGRASGRVPSGMCVGYVPQTLVYVRYGFRL